MMRHLPPGNPLKGAVLGSRDSPDANASAGPSLPASSRGAPSVRTSLFLMVGVCVLPLFAFGCGGVFLYYTSVRAKVEQHAMNTAQNMALLVQRDLEARLAALRVLAMSRTLQGDDIAGFRSLTEAFLAQELPGANIALLRENGQQVMNTALPPDALLPSRRETTTLRQLFATATPSISDVFTGLVLRRPVVALEVPVLRPDGSVVYGLTLNPTLDAFDDLLGRQHLDQGWIVSLLDRQGITVARNLDGAQAVGQPVAAGILPYLLRQTAGILETTSREGIPVVVAFSRVPNFDWSVAVGISVADLAAPAWRAALASGVIGLTCLALALGLAQVIAWRITRPIGALRNLAAILDEDIPHAPITTGLLETNEVALALGAASRKRRAAEAALRESGARLDRAQAIAGIGSWELDVAAGRYIWSKELYRIHGVSPEEFDPNTGNLAAHVHPDDFPFVVRWSADLKAGRKRNTRETRIVRPNGEVRLLRVEGQAVTDPDGVIRRISGTMQDITDRRSIEQQLSQAQKMEAIGNFTGGMAHDFNNGLGIIIGNLELLERLVKADRTAAELCKEARDGAVRCADLIHGLLAFARRQPLHPQQIDVNALISRTAQLLPPTLGKNIVLTLDIEAPVWPALADPIQLEAALVNLATNARDAMPKGGRLAIATRTTELDAHYAAFHSDVIAGPYVLIEVSDNGTGIAPEVIGRIFEPFFTTKEPGRGTGLGLSMVFGFIKQSGGHVAIYSELGLGSTFRIYLPPAQIGDTEAFTPVLPPPVVGGDETVLTVDDNAQLRLATTRQLLELGYQVREAEHANAALTILSSGDRVDLLFTDVVMPGTMDGLDLALQAMRQRQDLKVLLTSGFPNLRDADQRVADCPFRLLNKPYSNVELARAVRDVLDKGVQ
jgi:PAS domain S-box-containing protein